MSQIHPESSPLPRITLLLLTSKSSASLSTGAHVTHATRICLASLTPLLTSKRAESAGLRRNETAFIVSEFSSVGLCGQLTRGFYSTVYMGNSVSPSSPQVPLDAPMVWICINPHFNMQYIKITTRYQIYKKVRNEDV